MYLNPSSKCSYFTFKTFQNEIKHITSRYKFNSIANVNNDEQNSNSNLHSYHWRFDILDLAVIALL